MAESVNIFRNILGYFLERNLSLRFDICTCAVCRRAMMDYLESRFDAVYISPDDPAYKERERELTRIYLQKIFDEINVAINKVSSDLPHPLEEDRDKALINLIDKIRQDRGVDFSQYRLPILKRRIALRLIANKVKSYRDYLAILASYPDEYEKLFEALTINVSEFFRDHYLWSTIEDIMRCAIERNRQRDRPTVIWSAGCARGEEPYSLAIIARELGVKGRLKIYATDIDKDSLARAARGVYDSMLTLHNVLKGYFSFDFDSYFSFRDGRYYVADTLKELIEFKYLDLTSSNYVGDVDIILCRNVFIYFTKPLQERIVDRFYRCLRDKGYLVTGETEDLVPEARLIFKPYEGKGRVYQKTKV